MAATAEDDGLDEEMEEHVRRTAAAVPVDDEEARKRVTGCTTILWDDMLNYVLSEYKQGLDM